jgi:transposase InsO family protein
MVLRSEFVALAQGEQANIRQLCRRYGISPTTGYKWLKRCREGQGLAEGSRRPARSPRQCPAEVEQAILALRHAHPAWGARKIKHRLLALGQAGLPATSTVHAILARHGCISAQASAAATPWQRFEHPAPNDLWQMDFKGHVPLHQGRCHPLTVLDDHSRFNLCLHACAQENRATVQERLIDVFRRYGLPGRMTMDNGAPWGDTEAHFTRMDVWLMKQGIAVSHSRPYHPQTQGKDERFHRTLHAEVLQGLPFADLATSQRAFDAWRTIYNEQRPHEALGMQVPQQRYHPSTREYQPHPHPPEYADPKQVRRVEDKGMIAWQRHLYAIGRAFGGERVAIRPTDADHIHEVFWSTHRIARIDLALHTAVHGKRLP